MTNNQTSIKLNKKQSACVAYIVKVSTGYEIGLEGEWAFNDNTIIKTVSTLKEVKEEIGGIRHFLTTSEITDFKKSQKIRSLKADLSIAISINDLEWVKECEKELKEIGYKH